MEISHHESLCPADWDALVEKAGKTASICQSCFWAELEKKLDQANPHFLYAGGPMPQAALLLLERKHRNPFKQAVATARGDGRAWLEWNFGPFIFGNGKQEITSNVEAILSWVDDYAKERGFGHVQGSLAHTFPPGLSTVVADVFAAAGYSVDWWGTFLVDLNRGAEEIWSSFAHAARKSVNKAKRMEVKVKRIQTEGEFESLFLKPNRQFKTVAGLKTSPSSRSLASWKTGQQYYRFFVATDRNDEVLATLGMYCFNGVATEISSSISPLAVSEKIPAQDLLHWEMLLAAKNEGCDIFDLAGVAPEPTDDKMIGIRRFKEKWGGTFVKVPRFYKQYRSGLRFARQAVLKKETDD